MFRILIIHCLCFFIFHILLRQKLMGNNLLLICVELDFWVIGYSQKLNPWSPVGSFMVQKMAITSLTHIFEGLSLWLSQVVLVVCLSLVVCSTGQNQAVTSSLSPASLTVDLGKDFPCLSSCFPRHVYYTFSLF